MTFIIQYSLKVKEKNDKLSGAYHSIGKAKADKSESRYAKMTKYDYQNLNKEVWDLGPISDVKRRFKANLPSHIISETRGGYLTVTKYFPNNVLCFL